MNCCWSHFESRVVDIADTVDIADAVKLDAEAVDRLEPLVCETRPRVGTDSAMRISGAGVRVAGGDPSCLGLYSDLVPPLKFRRNPRMLNLGRIRGKIGLQTFEHKGGHQELQQNVQEPWS